MLILSTKVGMPFSSFTEVETDILTISYDVVAVQCSGRAVSKNTFEPTETVILYHCDRDSAEVLR